MKFDAVRLEAIIHHACPFNSEKKRGGVALQLSNSNVHIHSRGAAEMVLASCTQFLDADGSVKPIGSEMVGIGQSFSLGVMGWKWKLTSCWGVDGCLKFGIRQQLDCVTGWIYGLVGGLVMFFLRTLGA